MEKFKIGSSTDVSSNEQPQYHGREDAILDKLHRCTEPNGKCSPEDAESLHKDFEHCEAHPIYNAYVAQQIPTFDRMESGLARILESIPDNLKDDENAQRLVKLLKGRVMVVKGDVRSYSQSIIKFIRLRESPTIRFHKLQDDFSEKEEQVRSDHERRRKHENLLRDLAETLKIFEEAYDYGLINKTDYREWLPGDTTVTPEGVVPLFSRTAIANRDLIKNWALAADFAEHFAKLKNILEQKK